MARVQTPQGTRTKGKDLTTSHRGRLIRELRADARLAAEYLNAAAEDEDPRIYLVALGTVAEAKGMANVASAVRMPRESLYRALFAGGNPRFATVHAILKATGLKLAVARNTTRR
jgi:probable addiction module antidote protein